MLVELVRVTTADGLRLEGALQSPPKGSPSPPFDVDAFLLVHGTGANFYSSTLLEHLGRGLVESGAAALYANTRGHDLLATAAGTDAPRRIGAAVERVDDAGHDLAAWIAHLSGLGHGRIGLIGHSLGAIKGVRTLALEQLPAVACLMAVSPARLSYSYFLTTRRAELFRETIAAAEAHVREGRPETLMQVKFPLPYVVTAEGYLDKYGPDERYNVLNYVDRLPCPALFTFGSVEVQGNVAFMGLPEAIEKMVPPGGNVSVAVVAGGDHVYSGVRAELSARIASWLRQTLPRRGQASSLQPSAVNPQPVFVRLEQLLIDRGVAFTVLRHAPVYTSSEAAAVRGTPLASGAKALVCKADGRFLMIVLPADRKLASKQVRKDLGVKGLRFADADEVLELTGLAPGSIPPFGSLFNLPTYCDSRLGEHETINFNAGDHSISVSLRYDDYLRVENPELGLYAE